MSTTSNVEMTDSVLDQELGITNAESTTGLTGELDRAQLEVKLDTCVFSLTILELNKQK